MTPERWRKIEDLWEAARNSGFSRHSAILQGSDPEVRSLVERMLALESGDHFLDSPVPDLFESETQILGDKIPLEMERLLAEHQRAAGFRTAAPHRSRASFPSRFEAPEHVGAGSYGEVYRAFDKERNSVVALKVLSHLQPANLLRFKREFRSLVDLAHPNLVQLYELFGGDEQWFFSMEFVDGTDFVSYLRPAGILVSWERLRNAFFQLALGVQALHAAALIHRDLKPSNVLVKADGLVVILDFGLVRAVDSIDRSSAFAGSPAFMAPEQSAGTTALGPAADWYAVGVMLYRAITSQLPFSGSVAETLERKRSEPAPSCADLAPDTPQDLEEACRWLLDRDPRARTKGASILLAEEHRTAPVEESVKELFVGRQVHLDWLQERFRAHCAGNRQVVLVQGRSGFGKTALLSRFLGEIKHQRPDTVVLRGRCRSSEAVPYKALDPIADELVRHLRALAEPESAALLPRNPGLLRRLFPVFAELDVLKSFHDRSSSLDGQNERRRAFEALSELLGRMVDRGPVVIAIDDVQWSDLDSIAFLAELVSSTSSPSLMLMLCFRSEEAATSPALLALRGIEERLPEGGFLFHLEVGGLPDGEGRELLELLRREGQPLDLAQSGKIVRESRGSPLLLSELNRFASDVNRGFTDVTEMIRHRAAALSETAQELLAALSVADEPLSVSTLYAAAGGANAAGEVRRLLQEHLARSIASPKGERFEPFHDQVREASLSALSAGDLKHWHARLAHLLEQEENPEPQRILRHYRESGNPPAAYRAALAAAAMAENTLAFEQAARFYDEAIKTGEASGEVRARLLRQRADAFAQAGRGYESAQSFLEAAQSPAYNDEVDMRRRAAEQLMRAGYLDEGTNIFSGVLQTFGIRMPRSPLESAFRMLALRAFIRIRGLRWKERAETDIDPRMLKKLDLLWSGALVLSTGNPIFGNYLQARHMLGALKAGEPYRLALSLGLGAMYESLGGTREEQRGRTLIHLAMDITKRFDDAYLTSVVFGQWAAVNYMGGSIVEGLEHIHKSISLIDRDRRNWESVTGDIILTWFLSWGGRIREMSERLPKIIEEGHARGDMYAVVSIRCLASAHLVDLAADDPEGAIAETLRFIKQWRKSQYDLQHFGATLACMECHFYAGRDEVARQLLLADWRSIGRSLLFRKSQLYRAILYYARGRTALAEWLRNPATQELRGETLEYARRLTGVKSPWGDAFALLLRAGLEAGLGHAVEAGAMLERAEEIFRQQDLRLFAAAALRRRGELRGAAGADLIDAADGYMRSQNVVRPDRMTAMVLPGAWLKE